MDNIAIRLAAAAVKERIPTEYVTKYVDLLLEECKHHNDKGAEWHHADTIHHTINDVVSQYEEKIVPCTDAMVSDIQREFASLAARRNKYTSIYEWSDEDHRATSNERRFNGVRTQCLKNFFDGNSFSSSVPLKNAARRYIIAEAEDLRKHPVRNTHPVVRQRNAGGSSSHKNKSKLATAGSAVLSPVRNTGCPAVLSPVKTSTNRAATTTSPARSSANPATTTPVKTAAANPAVTSTPRTVAQSVNPTVSSPVKPTFCESAPMSVGTAAAAPNIMAPVEQPMDAKPEPFVNVARVAPPQTTISPAATNQTPHVAAAPRPIPPEASPSAPEKTSTTTTKRHWDASNAGDPNQSDGCSDRAGGRNNKKPSGNDCGGFKSGMDFLAKRCAEGKVPGDIDLGKPKKPLGLSYPSRSPPTNINNGVSYNGGVSDLPNGQPMLPERYIPLVSADVTPDLINLVLNMKLDVGLYNVSEDDIAGLEAVKKTLKDKVVQPILRPELHTGLLRAPKGVLLFGPPGTGKTTLAKWIANVSKANCFEVSPSSITSKFHGESESIIKTLFKVADFDHPSIVFIDEVDALLGKRGSNEADLSIRMKNQLLQMMDGLHCSSDNRVVVVIATTNRPTMLDDAALRRFGKRVMIPLPDVQTRQRFIFETLRKNCNGKCELSTGELEEIANATEGWNGSDLMALCMKAAEYSYDDTVEAYGGIDKIPDISAFRGIVMNDFMKALQAVHPSYSARGETYFEDWNKQYGSH